MIKRSVFVLMGMMAVTAVGGAAGQAPAADEGWCRDERSDNSRQQVCEVREIALGAAPSMIAVDATPNGGIEVTGSARAGTVIRAKVTAWAETQQQARSILSGVRIDAADPIRAEGPRGLERREGWSVSYRLAVPTRTSLHLRSTNGGISVEGVDGRIEFTTVNGGVKLAALAGQVHGRTSNGGVDVSLDGTTWQGEGLDVETSNGGVKLRVPAAYSARLDAGTVNGGIRIEFPVATQGRIDREVTADLGGGGPLIRVRTHNGGVSVTKK